MCEQFWLVLGNLRELAFKRVGDPGMKRASKATLVAKLKAARDRKRARTG
jgi:hypothetical protein